MREVEIAVVVILCAVLAACGGMAIQVTHQPQKEGVSMPLDGVPFYTKAVACKHETVWIEQTYRLTLVATQTQNLADKKNPDQKPFTLFSVSKEISQDVYSRGFQTLKQLVNTYDPTEEVNEIQTTFDGLQSYTPPAIDNDNEFSFTTTRFILVSNQNEPVSFIDYAHPYYYNAKIPWVGTVNAEVNLSPELTLSKATANVTEQTLKTFLDLLPIKEVLTDLGKAALLMGEEPKPVLTHVQLTIEPQVYKYTLSKLEKTSPKLPCEEPKDIISKIGGKNESNKVTFSRTLMTADESKKKEDGGNTIKFSGSVDLPKSQPQPTGSQPQPTGSKSQPQGK